MEKKKKKRKRKRKITKRYHMFSNDHEIEMSRRLKESAGISYIEAFFFLRCGGQFILETKISISHEN